MSKFCIKVSDFITSFLWHSRQSFYVVQVHNVQGRHLHFWVNEVGGKSNSTALLAVAYQQSKLILCQLSMSFPFRCSFKHAKNDERALEAIQVKTCDLTNAGSDSETIQFTFCNKEINKADLECAFESKPCGQNVTKQNVLDQCCRTNKFGWYNLNHAFWKGEKLMIDGRTHDDDGGDKLGPCEGFEINGPKVYTYGNYSFSTYILYVHNVRTRNLLTSQFSANIYTGIHRILK